MSKAYFLGCSFTSASETEDHNILGITFEECNNLKKTTSCHDLNEMMADKLIRAGSDPSYAYQFIRESGKKNSWAAILSDLMGVECINLAEGGGSIEECLFNLKLVDKHLTENDFVFLGLPPIPRLFFLNDCLSIPQRIMLANPHGLPEWDHLVPFYPDIQLDRVYFSAIDDIIRICEARKVKLFILPVFGMIHSVYQKISRDEIETEHGHAAFYHKLVEFFREIEQKISNYYINCSLLLLSDTFRPQCGYCHPNVECHREYGIMLYNYLKENNHV